MADLENYPGRKNGSGIFQNIINLMPKHDIYIEPFLGSGAILKNKDSARVNIGIDISSSIIKNYITGQGSYYMTGDSLKFLDAGSLLINSIHEHFQKILIYCDPPYRIITRRSGSKIYKNEFTDIDHANFLAMVPNLKCYVMISCYDNDMYSEALHDWNKEHFKTVTRKGKATETVYYNFNPDLPKHQYNFMGKNFRERAAIKGRVNRNALKIMNMPQNERNYLLDILSKKIRISGQ